MKPCRAQSVVVMPNVASTSSKPVVFTDTHVTAKPKKSYFGNLSSRHAASMQRFDYISLYTRRWSPGLTRRVCVQSLTCWMLSTLTNFARPETYRNLLLPCTRALVCNARPQANRSRHVTGTRNVCIKVPPCIRHHLNTSRSFDVLAFCFFLYLQHPGRSLVSQFTLSQSFALKNESTSCYSILALPSNLHPDAISSHRLNQYT